MRERMKRAARALWRLVLRWQNPLVGAALLALVLVGLRLYPHAPLSAAQAGSSTALFGADGSLLRLTLSPDDKYRQWLPLAQMPPALVEAVLLHEDAWFRWHPGFNPLSLARGAWISYVRGGHRQGGSTLTMQLARLMYRLNTRSPAGKAEQVLRAVWLELRYSKDDILEAYLNYAPYGRNVEGVAAASLVYFGKRAQDLSLPEALALAVIPQDPTRRLREAVADSDDQLNRGLRAARERLYARWRARHPNDALNDALMRLPLQLRTPAQLPFAAPHAMEQVLRDVPSSFGPFTPENYDGRFLGPVTATDALIRSRNIPAVWIASQLAEPNLYTFLKRAGISRLAGERHYGLALVLGGGEVTMQELATLYAMLANHGVLKPLRLRADVPQSEGVRLLSDEASFMTLDMLRQNPRPDEATTATPARLPIYWKTGTSWGFRDAWTAGMFGPYVLVVWMGNFDGAGNPALIGVETAAPLFFRIADAILARDRNLAEPAWTIPSRLRKVEICLASGDLPNAWCPRRGTTWFIPGVSPIRVSTVHRPVTIDLRTGKTACPPFDPATTRTEVYEYWPSDLARVFAQAGIPRRQPPADADCGIAAGAAPQITSPLRGASYTVRARRDAGSEEARVAFSATVDAGVREVYWFVDDDYIGAAKPGESLFWQPLAAGTHSARAVDDHGRSDTRELRVIAVD